MKIFNIEIRLVPPGKEEIKQSFLDRTERNAQLGLVEAQLELRHHSLLLGELEAKGYTKEDSDKEHPIEREMRLLEEAIERDHKSINNWQNQLRAINYERS
jgi:uncharacterized protein YhaN